MLWLIKIIRQTRLIRQIIFTDAKVTSLRRFHGNTVHKLLCKPKDRVATTEDKTISFMKLTVVTVKQSTALNLNGL